MEQLTEEMMTVGELRKALDGLPDDMPVVSNDAGGTTTQVLFAGELTFGQVFDRGNLADRDANKVCFYIG